MESEGREGELRRLIGRGVAGAMRNEDFAALRRWVGDEMDAFRAVLPGMPAGRDAAEARQLEYALATALWGLTPLPSNGYRPQPRPAVGRNDPCPCGSGEKHKRCCGGGRALLPRLDEEEAWEALAAQLPDAELQRLIADRRMPVDLLTALADELGGRDHEAAAVALLPWFEDVSQLDERHEGLLDAWLDHRSRVERASDFVEAVLDLEDELPQELRPVAWRALVPPAIALRDIELAKEMLSLLLETTPNDPTLAGLEVTTLLAAGETTQAGVRARFWLGFLRRHKLEEVLGEMAARLEKTASDPEAAAREFRADEQPLLAELAQVLAESGQRPVTPLPIRVDGDEGSFEVPEAIRAAAAAWREAWPRREDADDDPHGDDVDEAVLQPAQRWMDVLRAHPEAFSSLEVLDDLASLAWGGTEIDQGWEEPLLVPLLDHAEALVRASIAAHGPARLPWADPANRPALRLLAHRAAWLDRRGREADGDAVRAELLVLNPTDEQGHRAVLIDHALRNGEDARALELAQSDDDLAQTLFGRGLALWRLGRRAEAEEVLRAAAAERPLVARLLAAEAEPEKPEIDDGYVTVGGEDEAWLYREQMRDVWQRTPEALEFLKGLEPPLLPRRRPHRG